MSTRKSHSPRLHTWTQDQKFFGLEIGARMTAVDLDGAGSLLVISPIHLTENIAAELKSLGQVRYVVAPNKWHHLYLNDFRSVYPDAQYFCAPGLEKKRADFRFDGVIDSPSNFPWNPHLEHHLVEGASMFSEVVFHHPQSRSLIMTDTGLHICESSPFLTKIVFRLMGGYKKFGLTYLERKAFIEDAAAFRRSMERIALWDFDRIIVAHGDVIESCTKNHFTKAYL